MCLYFVVAVHTDRAAAEGDYRRLERLHWDTTLGVLDAVVLARDGRGHFRFAIASGDARAGFGCGLAGGLAMAVHPPIAFQWDSASEADRLAARVVVDRIGAAVGRVDLKRYGLVLDSASVGLVAAAASERAADVASALSPSLALASGYARIDRAALAEDVRHAMDTAHLPAPK